MAAYPSGWDRTNTSRDVIAAKIDAHRRFLAAVNRLVDAGQPPPCTGRPEWTSEAPEDRRRAAGACQPCPLRAACQATARACHESAGVWGGKDFNSRTYYGKDRENV